MSALAVSTDVRTAIAAANEQLMATFRQGDVAGLAALYTETGQLLPRNAGVMSSMCWP